jgi:hypothetical protein
MCGARRHKRSRDVDSICPGIEQRRENDAFRADRGDERGRDRADRYAIGWRSLLIVEWMPSDTTKLTVYWLGNLNTSFPSTLPHTLQARFHKLEQGQVFAIS